MLNGYTNPLAVLLPAACHNAAKPCGYCRVARFGVGDPQRVQAATRALAPQHDLVYLTANGEPGYMKGAGYSKFVEGLIKSGSHVAVLCASPVSLQAGMSFAEISFHRDHSEQCGQAIERAKELGIAPVLVLIDDGCYTDDDLPPLADQFAVDLVLVRKLQGEGLAMGKGENSGRTRIWRRNINLQSWYRAIDCYGEISDLPIEERVTARLVNEFGRVDSAAAFGAVH